MYLHCDDWPTDPGDDGRELIEADPDTDDSTDNDSDQTGGVVGDVLDVVNFQPMAIVNGTII